MVIWILIKSQRRLRWLTEEVCFEVDKKVNRYLEFDSRILKQRSSFFDFLLVKAIRITIFIF